MSGKAKMSYLLMISQQIAKVVNQKLLYTQFSIHYYFENDNSLNNFLNNVKKYLRQHGYVIITTFDANIVHNSFNTDGKINTEYMSSDGNKTILYDINRLYPSNTKNLKQTGLAIDVLMKYN